MHKDHPQWTNSVTPFVIPQAKLWMQIIHDKHVLNPVRGIILNDQKRLSGFNINTRILLQKNACQQVILNNYIKLPFYFIAKQIRKFSLKLRMINKRH